MKIIVLTANSSSGKSTTLNIAYNEIISLGGISTNKQPLGGNPHDFSDIVEWMGKRIAFFTMGDFSRYLIEAAERYSAENADVLVCACNKKFVKPLPAMSKYAACHVIPKTVYLGQPLQDIVNQIDASMIISHI